MASGLTGCGFGSDWPPHSLQGRKRISRISSAVKREPAIGPGFAKETSLLGFTGRSGITNHSAPDASRSMRPPSATTTSRATFSLATTSRGKV